MRPSAVPSKLLPQTLAIPCIQAVPTPCHANPQLKVLHCRAYVYYKVKAVCDVPGMLKSDLKHKLYISIAQPDTVPPKPANNTNVSRF